MNLRLVHPASWKDYELIDSGDGEKLERFGRFTLIRPEPQALWPKALAENDWHRLAHARFDREQKDKYRFSGDVNGGWVRSKEIPDYWEVRYDYAALKLRLRLALTAFGHVGMFPEQGDNWNFIHDFVTRHGGKSLRVLNLFAYTGAASVVARGAGAEVVHVDASRPGLTWANRNMQLNELEGIKWVHEDALKFVRREARRGNRYHGIMMDPPPYGRGPAGEKWTLQEKLPELVHSAAQLLAPEASFFILNMYAAGLSAVVGRNVVQSCFPQARPDFGEFFLPAANGTPLPMGTFVRLASDGS